MEGEYLGFPYLLGEQIKEAAMDKSNVMSLRNLGMVMMARGTGSGRENLVGEQTRVVGA